MRQGSEEVSNHVLGDFFNSGPTGRIRARILKPCCTPLSPWLIGRPNHNIASIKSFCRVSCCHALSCGVMFNVAILWYGWDQRYYKVKTSPASFPLLGLWSIDLFPGSRIWGTLVPRYVRASGQMPWGIENLCPDALLYLGTSLPGTLIQDRGQLVNVKPDWSWTSGLY